MSQVIADRLISMLQTLNFYSSENFSDETKRRVYEEIAASHRALHGSKIEGYLLPLFQSVELRLSEFFINR